MQFQVIRKFGSLVDFELPLYKLHLVDVCNINLTVAVMTVSKSSSSTTNALAYDSILPGSTSL